MYIFSFSLVCASVAAAADYCSLAQLSSADDDRTNNWTALGLDALLNSNFTAASWLDISHSERKVAQTLLQLLTPLTPCEQFYNIHPPSHHHHLYFDVLLIQLCNFNKATGQQQQKQQQQQPTTIH
ncbi:hypothetical protein T11_11934 [Trichinella zimbabwensis]|uniref:Uncharacterized protein n=1 Tax=Trichinella zimbabwensis TaxID=268475 RepID=A0A0V1HYR6_9BILA|nr:hypothetical protein T11_11934 [Trichinella zimbabwensis]